MFKFSNLRHCSLFLLLICAMAFCWQVSPAQAQEITLDGKYDNAALAAGDSTVINVLVQITAPVVKPQETRSPVAVSLVIDRSGSMSEDKKLNYAIKAGKTLVNALDEKDQLAIVAYASNVSVLRPLAPVTDKASIIALLDSLTPTDYTNLSGGLEAGVKQLSAQNGKTGSKKVILLSDGLANRGVTNGELVAEIGAKAKNKGVAVSSVGLGLDYDENLMQLLAQRGGGVYYYIKDSEDLPMVFKQELDRSMNMATSAIKIEFEPDAAVKDVKIYGYSTVNANGKTEIESGDMYSGEKRQIMLRMAVTPKDGQTAQNLGQVRLNYKDPESGKEQTSALPLEMRVVENKAKADELAKNAEKEIAPVRDEALLLAADEAQVAAMQEMEKGNTENAKKIMQQNKQILQNAPKSAVLDNKIIQMEDADAKLDKAASDVALQKEMVKASKSGYYMSAKGSKQSLMLQPGDKGFMVEKLQTALKDKGFYKGEVNGVYDAATEEAVKAFQKSSSMTVDGISGQDTQKALNLIK